MLNQAGGKPVVFRTLDVGGDKVLPYWRGAAEENPAMGWRAIRIGLDRPLMLRQQMRALLRAAAGRRAPRHVPDDRRGGGVRSPRAALLELELERGCERNGNAAAVVGARSAPCSRCRRWSGSWRRCLRRVDFLSVGSNDLRQFLFASDRGTRASPTATTRCRRPCWSCCGG